MKAGAQRATSIVTSPAARDVAGVISPRLAHAMSVAVRLKRAVDAFNEAKAGGATAASTRDRAKNQQRSFCFPAARSRQKGPATKQYPNGFPCDTITNTVIGIASR